MKHSQTAKMLMREALDRAEAGSPGDEGVKEKIRGIVAELTGMEDDTDTTQPNEGVAALHDAARDLRKEVYTSKAEIGGASLATLRSLKDKVDALVEQSYETREGEEICVACVAPVVCGTDADCIASLEEAAESGDKQEFQKAVDLAKEQYPIENLEEYGKAVAEKRKRMLEDLRKETP